MSRAFDIDTTSPSAVAEEAKAIFDRMGFGQSGSLIRRLFDDVPRLFAGPPIGFITASLLALAFMGFSGMGAG